MQRESGVESMARMSASVKDAGSREVRCQHVVLGAFLRRPRLELSEKPAGRGQVSSRLGPPTLSESRRRSL